MPKKPKLEWGTKRLKGSKWQVGYYKDGRRIWENTKSTGESDAEALLQKRYAEINTGVFVQPSRLHVDALLDALITWYKLNKKKSLAWAELVVSKHLRPYFGKAQVDRFGQRHVEQYILFRSSEQGAKNATVNREIALLHRAFVLAKKRHEIAVVPEFPEKLDENNIRTGFFEEEEFVAVRSKLPDEVKPIVTFAYYTGCRRGEILPLRWSQVDLLHRVVRLEPGETKNDEGRTIPMNEDVYQVLQMQKDIRDQKWPNTQWVFFWHHTGERIKYFYDSWRTACEGVGLTDDDGKAQRLFHDLRRTGVRNLVRAGVPEKVAMAISGHKTRAVFDRYNIVNEADLHWAMQKLDAHRQDVAKEKAAKQQEGPNGAKAVPTDLAAAPIPSGKPS